MLQKDKFNIRVLLLNYPTRDHEVKDSKVFKSGMCQVLSPNTQQIEAFEDSKGKQVYKVTTYHLCGYTLKPKSESD